MLGENLSALKVCCAKRLKGGRSSLTGHPPGSGLPYRLPVTNDSARTSFRSQFSYQNLLPRLASLNAIEQTNPKLAMAAWSGSQSFASASAMKATPIKPQKNNDRFQKRSNSNCRALTDASYLALPAISVSLLLCGGSSIRRCSRTIAEKCVGGSEALPSAAEPILGPLFLQSNEVGAALLCGYCDAFVIALAG